MFRITCCNNCENRTSGCHGTCKEYKGQKERYEKEQAEIRRQRNAYYAPIASKVRQVQAMKKSMGYK